MVDPSSPSANPYAVWSTLQALARTFPAAVICFDHRLTVRVANETALRLLGLPPAAEIRGLSITELVQSVHPAPTMEILVARHPVAFDWVLTLHTGEHRRVSVTLFPLFGRQRNLGAIMVAEDHEKRRESERERLTTKRALIQLEGIHVFLLDRDRRIIFCNRLPEAAVGLTLEQALPLAGADATSPPAALVQQVAELVRSGAPFPDPAEPRRIQERYYRFHVQHLAHENMPEAGLAVFVYDITAETQLKAELRRAEQLAVIGDLANNTAHELRNPLSAIRALAQLGMRLRGEEAKDLYFSRIVGEVERLDHYIDDLLALPKSVRASLSPLDVVEVLEEALILVQGELIAQRIEVVRELPRDLPKVEGEHKLLRRALLNLLVNAGEAMSAGGRLTLAASLLAGVHSRSYVRLVIADTGRGYSQSELENLFSPVTPGARSLSMAIAHQIITQHHRGRLDVQSEKGQGTRVTIELPVAGES